MNRPRPGRRAALALSGLTRRAVVMLASTMLIPAATARAATRLSRFAEAPAGALTLDHGAFDGLLARRTSLQAGVVRVDYRGWKASAADRAALKAYIARLAGSDPTRLTRAEQFAFWANLYNAVTIDTVLAAYPVKSIRDIRPTPMSIGPWKARAVTVGGVALSLDDIENGILRAGWRDPRVHYAINCASFGCPNLPRVAWRGQGLSARLDAAARDYVNHPRGARFEGDKLVVSSIYRWFAGDFGGGDRPVLTHLSAYAAPALKARLGKIDRIGGDAYDWTLNERKAS
ncbi:MAG: DUF547 domain-containing protein [Caulobacter sp.]